MNTAFRWTVAAACLAALVLSACDPKKKLKGDDGDRGERGQSGVQGKTGPSGAPGLAGTPGSADAWSLTGNAGTVPGTNFLGTLDSAAFEIRVDAGRIARFEPEGAGSSGLVGPNVLLGGPANSVLPGAVGAAVNGGSTLFPNAAKDDFCTIGGGSGNQAGDGAGTTADALGATVAGGEGNFAIALDAFVGGGASNTAEGGYSAIAGGNGNYAQGDNAFIGGGYGHLSSGDWSLVAGGRSNSAGGDASIVGGGGLNDAAGLYAAILGGKSHIASGDYSGVAAGEKNWATGDWAFVGGGGSNWASGSRSGVLGGESNTAAGDRSFVGGGNGNSTADAYASVVGGNLNAASGQAAFVGGGDSNAASGGRAVVCGGYTNSASALSTFVGSGTTNTASAFCAATVGGSSNDATGSLSAIVGGSDNTASGGNSIVGGGSSNSATSTLAAILGGSGNVACGEGSAIPGGMDNETRGLCALAAGRRARTQFDGSFVWADVAGAAGVDGDPFRCDVRANQFNAFASGGVRFVTRYDAEGAPVASAELAPGGSSWLSLLDRASVTGVAAADPRDVLLRLRRLPIATWSFTAQHRDVRHLGPLAEDFRAAFGLGESDRHIGHLDADGVALAAIQGLALELDARDARIAALEREGREQEQRTLAAMAEKEARIGELQDRSEGQERKIADLEARLSRLEALLERK